MDPTLFADLVQSLKEAKAIAKGKAQAPRRFKVEPPGVEIVVGSGNVFADLGLPDAGKLKFKSALVIEIIRAVRGLGLTPEEAGRRMGIPEPKVSGMMRGDFKNLSEGKLMECLNRLGYDIQISVSPATEPVGSLTVAVTA